MSQVYAPHRPLGLVAQGPAIAQHRGTESFVTAACERSFLIYDVAHLHVVVVGPSFQHAVRALAAYADTTFVATGPLVVACDRGVPVATMRAHSVPVRGLLCVGDSLLSYDGEGCVCVWDCATRELRSEWWPFGKGAAAAAVLADVGEITCAMHPDAYLNKVVLGTTSGKSVLLNYRSGKTLYTFPSWGAAVLTLAQTPTVDLVAAGLQDGSIVFFDLRTGKKVVALTQSVPVVSLAFRTDGPAVALSGAPDGSVRVWDVAQRTLLSTLPAEARHGSDTLFALPGKPLVVAAGGNSMRVLQFDALSSLKLLRQRRGPLAPPTIVRFGSEEDLYVAGPDGVFRLHIAADRRAVRFSDAKAVSARAGRPLRAVVALDVCSARERDWSNMVTAHAGDGQVVAWRTRTTAAERVLVPPRTLSAAPVTSVVVSSCGHFCVVGRSDGSMDVFNLQSGLHRGRLSDAHTAAVTALAQDSATDVLVSCSLDASMVVWSFARRTRQHTIALAAPAALAKMDDANGLVAVACDDLFVYVVDTVTARVVRSFGPHTARVTSVGFSYDSKFLLTSAADGCVRTFDMATATLADWFRTAAVPLSVGESPDGMLLASAHVGAVGVMLWNNLPRTEGVVLHRPPAVPAVVPLPIGPSGAGDQGGDFGVSADDASDDEVQLTVDAFAIRANSTHSDGLTLLSGVPASRWTALRSLDVVRERSKPALPASDRVVAPFFLPTVSGLQPDFAPLPQAPQAGGKDAGAARLSVFGTSQLATVLRAGDKDAETRAADLLRTLNTGDLDLEIRTLRDAGDVAAVAAFLASLLERGECTELAFALAHVLLVEHEDTIVDALSGLWRSATADKTDGSGAAHSSGSGTGGDGDGDDDDLMPLDDGEVAPGVDAATADALASSLKRLGDAQRARWRVLEPLLLQCSCLLQYFTGQLAF